MYQAKRLLVQNVYGGERFFSQPVQGVPCFRCGPLRLPPGGSLQALPGGAPRVHRTAAGLLTFSVGDADAKPVFTAESLPTWHAKPEVSSIPAVATENEVLILPIAASGLYSDF